MAQTLVEKIWAAHVVAELGMAGFLAACAAL